MAEIIRRAEKGFRHDTDDRELLAVEENRFTQNALVGIKVLLPERLTNHHHRMSIRSEIFFRCKAATQHWLDAHRVKIITGNQFAPDDRSAFVVVSNAAFAEADAPRSLPGRTQI